MKSTQWALHANKNVVVMVMHSYTNKQINIKNEIILLFMFHCMYKECSNSINLHQQIYKRFVSTLHSGSWIDRSNVFIMIIYNMITIHH